MRATERGRFVPCAILLGVLPGLVAVAGRGPADEARVIAAGEQGGVQTVVITAAVLRALPEWRIGEPVLRIGEDPNDLDAVLHGAGLPVRLSDGRIAVPNEEKEIRYYDAGGKLITVAGQRGQGPGDFRQLRSIHPLPGDSLLAFDSYAAPASRFSVFSPAGRYVRLDELDARSAAGLVMLPDRAIVRTWSDGARRRAAMSAGAIGIVHDTALVLLTRLTGKTDTLMRVPASPSAIVSPTSWTGVVLAAGSLLAGGPGGIVAGYGDSFELHWFDTNGKPVRIVRVDAPRERVTDAMKERYERSQPRPSRAVAREEGLRPTPIYASHLPVLARIRMDRAGRLWVRRWTFDDEPTTEWIVFTAGGRPVARMQFPSTFTFHDADTNYVLGRYTDPDGVESVRMYRPRP